MAAKPRFDWFQTESEIVLTILKRGVDLARCQVAYNDRKLSVAEGDLIIFENTLADNVQSENFTVQCTQSKVEIKMPKVARGKRWTSLVQTSDSQPESFSQAVPVSSSSSIPVAKKNWDAIEKQVIEEEKDEPVEGDAAVNKMFRKIYEDASDDVKKAMMKSYQESGGTVLSTNWADIGNRKVEVQPPDCMEYKKFEA